MATITEDYVSFEVAKLLKEKGFGVPSFKPEKWIFCMYGEEGKLRWGSYSDNWYCRATLQMAMKWLREVHHYYIQVMLDSWACGGHSGYYVVIQKTNSEFEIMLADKVDKVFYDEPEQAYEAALKYILENLI